MMRRDYCINVVPSSCSFLPSFGWLIVRSGRIHTPLMIGVGNWRMGGNRVARFVGSLHQFTLV